MTLRNLAIALLAARLLKGARTDVGPLAIFDPQRAVLPDPPGPEALAACLREPAPEDALLVALGGALGLTPLEYAVIAIAVAIEEDAMLGRALAHLQAPLGTARPTLGLLGAAFPDLGSPGREPIEILSAGVGVQSGLLVILGETAPLPERAVAVPLPLCLALRGQDAAFPGVTAGLSATARVPLPPSIVREAQRHAGALRSSGRALVLRTGSIAEGKSVAEAIAGTLGKGAAFVETDRIAGLAPWLLLRNLLPVFAFDLGPGERKVVPAIPFFDGPVLALAGPDGAIATAGGAAVSWSLPVPSADERHGLWQQALGDAQLAGALAENHRHGSGRIAHLGKLAHHRSAIEGRARPTAEDIVAVSWVGEGAGLDGLAQPLTTAIADDALVVAPQLRDDLEFLLARCRVRDGLVRGLGPSATTRYTPGVRALFVGPSGTGKTLAAGWLATRLGVPLFRVDLASVTSKYIGETEKNLAQVLARAEHAEVVLLFDEADSIFGKRTDIKEANDRFANSQTNYLLQRIETFEGIALLTSNNQSRFDSAFTRRLDVVLEFTSPSPQERRSLWESHLGARHSLNPRQLDQLAALADVEGGQIRNAVLTAAVLARSTGRPIEHGDVLRGLTSEYKKLGRQPPHQLKPY